MMTRTATFKIQPSYTEVSKPYAKLFKLIETDLHHATEAEFDQIPL